MPAGLIGLEHAIAGGGGDGVGLPPAKAR